MSTEATSNDAIVEQLTKQFSPEVKEEAQAEPVQAIEETEEADSGEVEASTEDGEAKESEAPAEDDEGLTLSSVLGIPEDRIIESDSGELYIEVKVDGVTERISPQKLVENYQREQHANAKSMEAAEQLKRATVKEAELKAQYEAKFSQAEQVVQLASQQLLGQYQGVDWETLEATDPGQAALLRQKMDGQATQIQQAQQAVLMERQQQQQKAQQEQQAQYRSYLQEQMDKVVASNPNWADEAVRTKEFGEIKDFMISTYGYTADETAGVDDARQVQILRDAMAYRQGKAKAEPKLQKKVPKFQKPGVARSQATETEKKQKAQRARLRKTGSTDDLAAILADRF